MRTTGLGRLGFCALALTALIFAGCSSSGSMFGNNSGGLRIVMDGPATEAATLAASQVTALNDGSGRTLMSASISITSILARNLDGELIEIALTLPADVDLIALVQGGTYELPTGALPAGSYDQIVVVIKSLTVGLSDGTEVEVRPPGGGWTAVVNTDPFDVADGAVTTVTLHFRASRAFEVVNGELEFNPGFDCEQGGGDNDD